MTAAEDTLDCLLREGYCIAVCEAHGEVSVEEGVDGNCGACGEPIGYHITEEGEAFIEEEEQRGAAAA